MESHLKYIKFQISDLKKRLSTCNDELNRIVLSDILCKKIRELRAIEKLRIDELRVSHALDEIIEQQNENDTDVAYQRILLDNQKEQEVEEHDKKWNKRTDPKFDIEIAKDYANNKLMDRMNSELAFRINGRDKETIVKPFLQQDDDDDEYDNDYVSIKKFKKYGIPTNSFSSKRFLGKRKNI